MKRNMRNYSTTSQSPGKLRKRGFWNINFSVSSPIHILWGAREEYEPTLYAIRSCILAWKASGEYAVYSFWLFHNASKGAMNREESVAWVSYHQSNAAALIAESCEFCVKDDSQVVVIIITISMFTLSLCFLFLFSFSKNLFFKSILLPIIKKGD